MEEVWGHKMLIDFGGVRHFLSTFSLKVAQYWGGWRDDLKGSWLSNLGSLKVRAQEIVVK